MIQIVSDKHILGFSIRNLLSNAIKFSNSGGIISVRASHLGEKVAVSVSDIE